MRRIYQSRVSSGDALRLPQENFGHSSIGITADIYRHVRTGEMHEEARRFAPMNGG